MLLAMHDRDDDDLRFELAREWHKPKQRFRALPSCARLLLSGIGSLVVCVGGMFLVSKLSQWIGVSRPAETNVATKDNSTANATETGFSAAGVASGSSDYKPTQESLPAYDLGHGMGLFLKLLEFPVAGSYEAYLAEDPAGRLRELDEWQKAQEQEYNEAHGWKLEASLGYYWAVDTVRKNSTMIMMASPSAGDGGLSRSHCVVNDTLDRKTAEEDSNPGTWHAGSDDHCWGNAATPGQVQWHEGRPVLIQLHTGHCEHAETLTGALLTSGRSFAAGEITCAP